MLRELRTAPADAGRGSMVNPAWLWGGSEMQKDCFLYERSRQVIENKGPHVRKCAKTNPILTPNHAQIALKMAKRTPFFTLFEHPTGRP
jgi:hypothetical protein